jgi:hypothetical protein
MEIRLTIPDKVASALQQQWPDENIPHHILEDLALIGGVPHKWLAALLREKSKHFYQEGSIVHSRLSTCASAASA